MSGETPGFDPETDGNTAPKTSDELRKELLDAEGMRVDKINERDTVNIQEFQEARRHEAQANAEKRARDGVVSSQEPDYGSEQKAA
jgi:hypothetical protein